MIDKHSRRRAVWIRQHLRIFDHHRLARVSFRHRNPETLKALPDLSQHSFIEQQPAPQRARSNLARDVVFGWTKPSGGNHHFGSAHSIFDCFFEAGIVVADDRLEFYFDPEAIKFLCEPETVGVGAIGRK